MPNTILTSGGLVPAPEPDPPPEGAQAMAEEYVFPRFYFSKDEPNGRPFDNQADLDAAGGRAVWKLTPQEATATAPPTPADEGEGPPPRPTSRR